MDKPIPGQIYATQRQELLDLARGLSDSESVMTVPQCPDWSIKDVLAHVCGINADVLAGNVEGIGTDAWTAVQVESRAEATMDEVCAEWESHAPAIDEMTTVNPDLARRAGADLVTHHHDICTALGRRADRETAAVQMGLERYGPFFCERVAKAGLPTLRVESGDRAWQSADGEPVAVLRGSAFELLRAFSGRRSTAQVQAMDWTGDPAPYLQHVSPYGLPTEDVVEP